MKNIKYLIIGLIGFLAFSCAEEEATEIQPEGNPVLEVEDQFVDVYFGDDLPFAATVSDQVPLSTLTAVLYFGEEEVSRTEIRTKENGEYSGTIHVPFEQNIPDGTATLEFELMNTTLKSVTQTFDVPVARAEYPYLILVTEHGSFPWFQQEKRMNMLLPNHSLLRIYRLTLKRRLLMKKEMKWSLAGRLVR